MVIALTGGICSGKSTAANTIRSLNIPIIDADEISRSLTALGGAAIPSVREAFGSRVVDGAGVLNRKELRKIIFSDPAQREKLNRILHPMIHEKILSEIAGYKQAGEKLMVLDIPLLYETGMEKLADRVICMEVPREEQARRIMERDHVGYEDALSVIDAQMPAEEKTKRADYVVSSHRPPQETAKEIASIIEKCGRETA